MTKSAWQLYDRNLTIAELVDVSNAIADTTEKLERLTKLQVSAIVAARNAGVPNAEIAKIVGVSRQRIYQLLVGK